VRAMAAMNQTSVPWCTMIMRNAYGVAGAAHQPGGRSDDAERRRQRLRDVCRGAGGRGALQGARRAHRRGERHPCDHASYAR
jgi:hypothetical protein